MRITLTIGMLLTLGTSTTDAGVCFSIDFHGLPIGEVAFPPNEQLTEGDIVHVALPVPYGIPGAGAEVAVMAWGNALSYTNLGFNLPGLPPAPGVANYMEVDALSHGHDYRLGDERGWWEQIAFSVDEFATGVPYGTGEPNVASEGRLGAQEAAADVFVTFSREIGRNLPIGLWPHGYSPATLLFDGDGATPPSSVAIPFPPPYGNDPHGLLLVEPSPPALGYVDAGSNLDALDVDAEDADAFPIYFSLDSSYWDPVELYDLSGSAHFQDPRWSGADVLMVSTSGGPATVYAAAARLGLDRHGIDTDDLDALILVENGKPGYQPSATIQPPFDWVHGSTDMLLFSVRRGSQVIGEYDCTGAYAIEEGDILAPPPMGSGPPCVLITGDNLGLSTRRSGLGNPADDIDGLDLAPDCNVNNRPDYWDIAYGWSEDVDGDGIPDECELERPIADPSGIEKSRYISFDPGIYTNPTAIRVGLVSLDGYPQFNGEYRWVGPPQAYPEENSAIPGLTFQGSYLLGEPYYQDWGSVGLLHVFSSDVVPGSEYEVAAIDIGGNINDPNDYSTPLAIRTARWGDIVAPFAGSGSVQPDFTDIAAEVQKFLANPGAPIKAQTQLTPNMPDPTGPINFKDIAADVSAFLGVPYWISTGIPGPYSVPSIVPSGYSCIVDSDCYPIGGERCVGGICYDGALRNH